MIPRFELAELISRLYPLHDKQRDKRYRVIGELAGTTELEEMSGQPRYVQTRALRDQTIWQYLY